MKKTRRTMQIGDQIRAEIATILLRDVSDPDIKFVTITDVEVSTDMRVARAFVSVFGNADEQKKTLKALEKNRNRVRFLVGQRLKLRTTPEISFALDTTAAQATKIGKVLNRIAKQAPSEPAEESAPETAQDDGNERNDSAD